MNGTQFGALNHCLQNLPSEGQIRVCFGSLLFIHGTNILSFFLKKTVQCLFQATASEVQNLLVSGRKKEALLCAQEGQLWGPALILASQLGEQVWLLFHVVISFLGHGFIFEKKTVKFVLKLAPVSSFSHILSFT